MERSRRNRGRAVHEMERREFLRMLPGTGIWAASHSRASASRREPAAPAMTIFLAGDVMTGRGIDQILARPSRPELFEPYVKDAGHYVDLAEATNGPIPRNVPATYIWGDALGELDRRAPDVRIINLETAVTRSDEYWRGKEIHYRMHPENVAVLMAAQITCCTLANNHALDWGEPGLSETVETLERAGVMPAGAGANRQEAEAPAILPVAGRGRVLVFSFGSVTSGIPLAWAATPTRAGVNLLARWSDDELRRLAAGMKKTRQAGDLVVASIHWGDNWGYRVPAAHTLLAHRLIDELDVHIVHGHSSHHPLGIEVYRERPILYGCGDFLNDYEGIPGYEQFRSHLVLGYVVTMDPQTGTLRDLVCTPFNIRQFRLTRPSPADAEWLTDVLSREGRRLGTSVELSDEGAAVVRW